MSSSENNQTSESVCAKVLISGQVQGVGFRYFATSTAQDFPVNGYVRNLDTGDVEVEVEGLKGDVSRFLAALRQGPRWSHVNRFQIEWKTFEGLYEQFFVKFK
ncbi:MAG: acylphosphatase [candidate division Zixibacteria bacterium]|nr:acylphosphatase [candidate division Zixibacteria bacterium]